MLPRPGGLLHFSEDPSIRQFVPHPHTHVATHPVSPLGPPDAVGDLVRLHEEHAIELRVLPHLTEHVTEVRRQGLEFSAIRMGNADVGPGGPFATRR